MKSGIYKITNTINNKIYIGSAKNIPKRWFEHKNTLKNSVHPNKHLQQSYNKYGETAFIYSIIIYCNIKDLLFFEQRFLDYYWDGGETCYNISKNATAFFKDSHHSKETKKKISDATKGKKKSEETKKKMSLYWTGHTLSEESKLKISIANSGSNHPRFGKTISEQNRKNLTAAVQGEASYNSKLTEQQVVEIFNSNEAGTVLSKKHNISTTVISNIRTGKRWRHITLNLTNRKMLDE